MPAYSTLKGSEHIVVVVGRGSTFFFLSEAYVLWNVSVFFFFKPVF